MHRILQFLVLSNLSLQGAEEPVDFNRDVRPLLNKNCTICHGGVKQAGEVSFIFREEALGKGESGKTVVVPGDPAASEMMRRIKSSDPDEKMPPPDDHPHGLEPDQIALLERWIKEGAKWGEHWSFQQPEEPPAPALKQAEWPKAELDKHVLAKLEAERLSPAPEATPAEWFRRVSLDLTGLPPSLEEWDAFHQAAAANPQAAMEATADRLLASPRFGERWAAMWLDLARYSDTTGFEKDPHRDIWPFRDWVIRAFNADMPFDQFTIKQLAGDLLENPAPDDLVATGFHRNTQNNTEGGSDDEEYRLAAVMDRTSTTWTAWNATTFACVQCHAHPYDPFPHADYYKFMAFFDNTEDSDLNGDFPRTKVASDPAQHAATQRLEVEIRKNRDDINKAALAIANKISGWTPVKATSSKASAGTGTLRQQEDGTFVAGGTNPTNTVFTIEVPAMRLGVLRVDILPGSDDPAKWTEFGAVITKLEIDRVLADGTRQPVKLKEVVSDFMAGPFEPNVTVQGGGGGFGDYPVLRGPRHGFFVVETVEDSPADARFEIRLKHGVTCNETQGCVLRKFRLSLSSDEQLPAFVMSPERAAVWTKHGELQQAYQAVPGTMMPVMQERHGEATRDTRLFIRGNRMTKDQSVAPAIPAITAAPPPKEGRLTRLDMAQWLVGKENPLAARVLANRLWAELFGIGIVETQEDFGSSGLPPANQPLLDHLALRLRDHHQWHIKPFLRELVLSASYRQSSKVSPVAASADPKNQWASRGPRQRLSAEMVRDQALLVSGLLSPKSFGPPVFPPQPEGVWRSVYSGASWKTSEGEDRYRRALYTYSKRTSGYPAFLTFDAPTRDVCSARRIATNTPLQALVTLNDPAYIEFAQAFAKRMAGSTPEERIAAGYRMLKLEDAPAPVVATLAKLHAEARADYEKTPAQSAKLAATPDEAAMVLVANTLLNSDIALNR
ncbi:PSD1 and planctomycete cytochrome C domain-containing protein [Luteolibacter sp. GHJ8]|uniref:PSD1 and planctomycete cytochrome C domain-containing protein n=1 Tax=Luteolibacter rhizosphaerae TaxID=2989719 RepID=A0ABT3FZU9_9BACT|nr:PSD1 and planctomycete cytochrome C domain-containing protein [Luteolibacter rhizosphaerae]MCW1913116.1 PSD1 and planctomycete cytochrome C domain-containing protein [Luteolibacter rhizosphaerae]